MIKNLYDKLFRSFDEIEMEISNIDETENKPQILEGNIKEVIELHTFLQNI